MKKRIITFRNFANAPKTIYKFLGNTKINGKHGRLLREETILCYYFGFSWRPSEGKWVNSKII